MVAVSIISPFCDFTVPSAHPATTQALVDCQSVILSSQHRTSNRHFQTLPIASRRVWCSPFLLLLFSGVCRCGSCSPIFRISRSSHSLTAQNLPGPTRLDARPLTYRTRTPSPCPWRQSPSAWRHLSCGHCTETLHGADASTPSYWCEESQCISSG